MVNHAPFRWGRRGDTAFTISRHSRGALSYTLSALASKPDEYSMGFIVFFGSTCSSTHQTWASQASVSRVDRPSAHGKARTAGDTSFFWKVFIGPSSHLVSSNLNGWSFKSLSLSGNRILAKLGANRLMMLQRLRHDFNQVAFRGTPRSSITSVVRDAISKLPGRTTWPK